VEKRTVQLRTHQKNIDRYENMLKTELTDRDRQFVQRRLSEERFTIALLQFMSPSASSGGYDRPREH
jgi:hypothetical protein